MLGSENGIVGSDYLYAQEYGEKQFFEDLEQYGQLLGEDWGDIVAREQPSSMEDFHKKAIAALKRI